MPIQEVVCQYRKRCANTGRGVPIQEVMSNTGSGVPIQEVIVAWDTTKCAQNYDFPKTETQFDLKRVSLLSGGEFWN